MATKHTTKRPAAKGQKKPRKAASGPRGNMTREEITPLAILAKKAFDLQVHYGNLDASTDQKSWRQGEVMKAVGKGGLSKCDHGDFQDVLGHFALLAGMDEVALNAFLKSGKVKDHGSPEDTHEARRQKVHLIREAIGYHVILAETPEAQVSPKERHAWDCIQADPKGPIREGYAFWIARQKFGKQPRTIDEFSQDFTVNQLNQILFKITNAINAKEGRGKKANRNKKQTETRRAEMRARALGEIGPVPRI
jgi:hypothetical protein